MRDADLRGADLEEAEMANSRLEGACLVGTTFRRAYILGSVFRQVRMASTGFAGADLSECDFTGTEFNNAHLQDAILLNARLEGADLASATLTGADLHSAQPWQAKLYEEQHDLLEPIENPVATKSIGCVADLIDQCREIRSSRPNMVLYFRGEGRIEDKQGKAWKLEPSLMRDVNLRANERNLLLDLMSRRPEDFEHAQSALSQWVVAQHHGLKTRLLDIFTKPVGSAVQRVRGSRNNRLPACVFSTENDDKTVLQRYGQIDSELRQAVARGTKCALGQSRLV